MKKNFGSIFIYIVLTIFTLISMYFVYGIYKLNVLKTMYFLIIAILVTIILIFAWVKLLRKKTKFITKLIIIIISILLSVGYLFAIRYINTTIKFVDNMTSVKHVTQKYSVLVLKNSSYEKIDDLENKTIGFLKSNVNLDLATEKLGETIDFNDKKYDDAATLVSDVYNNNIPAVVLDNAYIEMLEDNDAEFIEDSKVIYTFEIEVSKKDSKKAVNITKDPFVLYISGSDSRGTVSDIARSDVNIVAVVNPKNNKILLVSIPRDYYVQLHDTSGAKDKLTHAGIYGIDMSKSTIEDLLDIDINYYTKVSFTTVINVVDVIDGIDINSDAAFIPHTDHSCEISLGTQHLDGKCALAYARERYTYETGDRHRGQNQQEVLTAIIKKVSNPKYLVKHNDILSAIDGSFATDLSYNDITNLIKYQLDNLNNWQVESIGLDGTGSMQPTYSMGSTLLYVMVPDQSTVENAKTRIKEYLEG